MNKYIKQDNGIFIEEKFSSDACFETEGLYSLVDTKLTQRGNFEEFYSGKTIRGTFVEGMDLDELKENGMWVEDFSEKKEILINAPDWTKIIVRMNDEMLDLNRCEIQNFRYTFNVREAYLERSFEIISAKGNQIQVNVKRFLNLADHSLGAISYTVKSVNFEGHISFMPVIDGDLENAPDNVNELKWNVIQTKTQNDVAHLWTQVKRSDFQVCGAMSFAFYKNNEQIKMIPTKIEKEKVAGFNVGTDMRNGDSVCLYKYAAMITSKDFPKLELPQRACEMARNAKAKGWNQLFDEHSAVSVNMWDNSDWAKMKDLHQINTVRNQMVKSSS